MQLAKQILPFGTVYTSKVKCIYKNLAFEEWIFRNHNLEKDGDALLLWSNNPAVVIGRHQNPFVEANLKYCQLNNINVVRRHSGGGAVYHDLGNLNISFLTSHSRHCRPKNLELLANFLNLNYSEKARISLNERDDLIFESTGSKVSGTAARISHGRAYHHLTLLVDVNIVTLKSALSSELRDKIVTNATKSVRAKSVGYLAQKVPDISVDDVREVVIDAFKSQFEVTRLIECMPLNGIEKVKIEVFENDEDFPGLTDSWNLLQSENWIYERTPKFYLTMFCAKSEKSFKVSVEKGKVLESDHQQFPTGNSFYRSLLCSDFFK